MKAKFIVFEGGEGSGKGMCIDYIKNKVLISGRDDVVFTREPGGTEVSERVRSILMDKALTSITPLTELFLFCAARAQHVEEKIKPALESGKHVICDRFDFSTIAYQIYGSQKEALMYDFNQLNKVAKENIRVDHLIFLDVKPEVGLKRKESSQEGICTRFDEHKLAYHNRVYEGYLSQLVMMQKDHSTTMNHPELHIIHTEELTPKKVKKNAWEIVRNIIGG